MSDEVTGQTERRLPGGNLGGASLRGDVVLRHAGRWTPAVHRLFGEFERAGLHMAPHPLGIEKDGREALAYIEGDTLTRIPWPGYVWTEGALFVAASMLRRLHDASVAMVSGRNWEWQTDIAKLDDPEVICHNDAAPYNTVYRDGLPVAFIDWDFAAPGPRSWDIAHAAYRFVPLVNDEECFKLGMTQPDKREVRFQQFCRAYGVPADSALRQMVVERVDAIAEFLRRRAEAGDADFVRMVREGHMDMYRRHAEWLRTRWLDLPGE